MNKIDAAEIKSRISIESLFKNDGHKLLNASGMKKCCCPFHNERTPSCCIYPDGHFYCFGCNASGSVIDYVMLRDDVDFKAAIEKLSNGWTLVKKFNPPLTAMKRETAPLEGAEEIIQRWKGETNTDELSLLAHTLGVCKLALVSLECVWARPHSAWGFPMRNHLGVPVGIRLRDNSGKKWAVKGSKEGLFFGYLEPRKPIWIVEGPTDCAAGIQLGLNIVGRPSCQGAMDETVKLIDFLESREVIIISDNDAAGLKGSERLESRLPVPFRETVLPCKDLREFVKLGGTRQLLESMVSKQLPQRKPRQ